MIKTDHTESRFELPLIFLYSVLFYVQFNLLNFRQSNFRKKKLFYSPFAFKIFSDEILSTLFVFNWANAEYG